MIISSLINVLMLISNSTDKIYFVFPITYIQEFLELFLILMVYYRITDDTGKITEKIEFNESLISA